MMKGWFLFCILIWSCNGSHDPLVGNTTDSLNSNAIVRKNVSEAAVDSLVSDDYTNYWIVVSDTGLNYDTLLNRMNYLRANLACQIDSMGRYYNRKKNLIALPEDDPDEIYAGEYFPRRFESDYLSIEYLNWYSNNSSEKMMAVVSGIFEQESSADSLYNKLKSINPTAYKFNSRVYTGCMH